MSTEVYAATPPTEMPSPAVMAAGQLPPHAPPHAPETGWVRRVLGPFYVTGVFWFRFHKFGVSVLPNWLIGPAIRLFASFFFLTLVNIRRAIGSNLEAVLGPCGWLERQRRIFRTLWTFSWCLTERYERLATRRPFHIDIEADGKEFWEALGREPLGYVLLTAHLGAWEAGSMVPPELSGRRVHVVREGETDPRAQAFFADLIQRAGGEGYVTHFAEDDPRLGVKLLDALRQGEVAALQGDRPRTCGRTYEAQLFGRPFALPVGPPALARAAGVPLVPVFIFREGRRRYRCLVRRPIRVDSTEARQADIGAAVERFAAELEEAIRREPHQWFCFRRLWPGAGE
jgi:phosphatidylinositol dimannoside acyltransferase